MYMYMHAGRLHSICTHACMTLQAVYISMMVMLVDEAKYVYTNEYVCMYTCECVPPPPARVLTIFWLACINIVSE